MSPTIYKFILAPSLVTVFSSFPKRRLCHAIPPIRHFDTRAVDTSYLIRRLYTQDHSTPEKPQSPRKPIQPHLQNPNAIPTYPPPRHEPHEKTLSINIPFNPPGAGGGPGPGGTGGSYSMTNSPLMDAAITTFIGLGLVFFGGIGYVKWYKKRVLDKIEDAFEAGYDPALELAQNHSTRKPHATLEEYHIEWEEHLRRKEQDLIDRIIHGEEPGHYFMLLGPKGSGKGTMVFDSMAAIQAEGVSFCDAHPDLEVFRLRLGKALNYEYHEDSQTGLFQRRDPREGGPALDIERAMNKLEKVALRKARRTGRPLVLVINNIHYFQNNEEGRNIILQLQQKAEAWAASGVMTLVFSSDDFWPFHLMRKNASRMHVVSVYDLDQKESLHAAVNIRKHAVSTIDLEETKEAISIVGGRLAYLSKVAKARNMVKMALELLSVEKAWLQSQIGLIPDCDDDVMDEQKWSSCSWLLLQEFVRIRKGQIAAREEAMKKGEVDPNEDMPLPVIPYWRCRQVMTRADFMEELDRLNVISIDIHHDVRPDSLLILQAAQEVVEEEGFEDLLNNVRDRIDEIESLHRTRELTFKDVDTGDMIRLSVDKGGAALAETLRRNS